MRKMLIVLPLLLVASPAFARDPAPQLPPELTDPATAQKLGYAMQALSSALLNVRIGEVKAALDGRQATREERNMTVGDLARRHDPDFDQHMQRQVAEVGPRLQQSMKALNQALPVMMRDLKDAQKSLERAVANIPDPTYPKR
jgi:DNA-binding transcriptional MerR regulator